MKDSKIAAHIARCIEIDRIVKTLGEERKLLRDALVAEADHDEDGQARTEGGGWSWVHEDHDGNLARVTKPGPRLKSMITIDGKAFEKIEVLTRPQTTFDALFVPVPAYTPCAEFRAQALALLPQDDAKKLIKLVTTESPVQLAFEVKENA